MNALRYSIILLATVAATNAWSQLALSTRLDPGKMPEDKRYTFAVKTGSTNAAFHFSASNTTTVNFTVTIVRKSSESTKVVEADLFTWDGKGEIQRMAVTNLSGGEKGYRYEFMVDAAYLPYSQFIFRERVKGRHGGIVNGDSFWFFLKDFVPTAPNKK